MLACYECNQERCRMEQAFLRHEKPELFFGRGNGRPAPKSLTRAQGKLCAAVQKYVEHCFPLVGPIGKEIENWSAILKIEYEKKARAAEGAP